MTSRREIVSPPRWASRCPKEISSSSSQNHSSRGKKPLRRSPFASSRMRTLRTRGAKRDGVGMLIPESILQAQHVSYDAFDRKVEECSREMLGFTETAGVNLSMENASDDRCSTGPINYGAAFDYSKITFHGCSKDARRLSEATTPLAIVRDLHGKGVSHISMDKNRYPSVMCSEPFRGLEAASHNMVAYVRETHCPPQTTTPSPDAKSDTHQDHDMASRRIVQLDNGEKISIRRDHLAAVRRVALGSLDNPTDDQSWLDTILSTPNEAETLLQKGSGEDRRKSDTGTASQRRFLRRLKKAERSDMRHGLTRHPCRVQGGGCRSNLKDGCICPALSFASFSCAPLNVASTMCPYAQYPSVCCVDYLRHGRCKLAELGCCPWFHGDPGLIDPQRLLAEFLITDEGVDEDATALVVHRLRETSSFVGLILQVIVDLIIVTIEENDSLDAFLGSAESQSSMRPRRIGLLRELLQDRRVACRGSSEQRLWDEGKDELCQWLSIFRAPTLLPCVSKEVEEGGQHVWCLGLDLSVVKCVLNSSASETVMPDDLGLKHDSEAFSACSNNLLLRTYTVHDPVISSVNRALSPHHKASLDAPETNDKVDIGEIFRIWGSFFALNAPTASADMRKDVQKAQYMQLSPMFTQWAVDAAAHQLSRARCSAHALKQNGEKQRDTPSELFRSAARYLLQRRVRDCEEFNLYFSSTCRGSPLPSITELGRLRWAPLLLLQDCVRLNHISTKDAQPQSIHDTMRGKEFENTELPLRVFEGEVGDEVSADKGNRVGPLFGFPAASSSPLIDQTLSPVLPTTFVLDALVGEYVSNDWSAKKVEMWKGSAGHALHTEATTSVLTLAWHSLHSIVLKLGLGILHCMEIAAATAVSTEIQSDPQNTSSAVVAQLFPSYYGSDGSAAGLFTFVQTALLHLGLVLSTTLSKRYERPLLDSAGWTSWTGQSMFGDEFKGSLYTAAGFARHHQPVIMFGCMNSLLNGLLLVVLQRAERMHALYERSPVRRLLLFNFLSSAKGSEATQWFDHQANLLSRVHLQRFYSLTRMNHSLRPYITASFSIWSSLHDHSQRVSAAREQAMKEFRAIRAEFDAERRSRKAQVRTRKYGDSPVGAAEDDQDTLPIMDLLLPYGSAALSAAATSRLLIILREGGSPYKSLRLAASVIRGARMLRHAARQPQPQYVQSTKTVHRMTRSRKTNRKHVTKVRVPVVKLVNGVNGEWDKEGGRCEYRALKAIGLVYALNEDVVHEALRVSLRMSKAGPKLSDGILDDCIKGALIDYAEGRCLPAPTPELVDAYLSWSSHTEPPQHVAFSVVPYLLQLLGLRAQRGEQKNSRLLEVDYTAYGRRIPPTALLLEILAVHTDLEDTARHRICLSLLQQDIHRFGTAEVCFAMQYRLVCCRPILGLSVMHRFWLHAIAEASAPWQLPLQKDTVSGIKGCGGVHGGNPRGDASVQELLWSKLRSVAEEELESYGGLWFSMGNKKLQRRTASNATPTTVQELKVYLRGESERDAIPSSQQRVSPKAVTPSYESLLYQLWLPSQPNEWHRVQLVWSLCAATLLGLSARQLEAAHETRRSASQCLFYCFVSALSLGVGASGGPMGMNTRLDQTVRVLLLSRLFSDLDGGHTRERGAEPSCEYEINKSWSVGERSPSRGCDGLVLSSAHVPRVRGLHTFLDLQQRLAMELLPQSLQVGGVETVRQGWVPTPWQGPVLVELKAFLNTWQRDIAEEAVPPPAWQLLQALLAQPSLALAWVERTLLSPSDALLMWIAAHADYRDEQEIKAIIRWLEALPRPTATAHAVLARSKKDYAVLQHKAQRLKKRFTKTLH
ncbi:unnamed protein product [Phytomonas sp. EM1]|nr:unnamed protein product [Phytomonas sp. EM1]|eukprot:CCW64642.1 unnamed protein product [Phytomonas sp. isolate EM1]